MVTEHTIRDATMRDAAACAAIYARYVTYTTITFETEPPSAAEMAERIVAAQRMYAWIVLEADDRVVGYAYAGPYRARAAYRWACEVTVYLETGRQRAGAGRALYEALFDRLAARGYRTVVAGISLPNDPSLGFHQALGFEPVGTFRRIGWKHGGWHDVTWVQRAISDDDGQPPEPR